MRSIPNYQTLQLIYESKNTVVYRGKRQSDHLPVILKILKKEYPTPEELARYRQEYDLIKSLDSPAVIKAYQIEKYQNSLAIILEDFGGESLKTLNKIPISTFLPLAIQITDNLRQLHLAQIIHKDINPANIVWNQTTHQVKIIDFGIASRLPRESPTLKNTEQLEGTLAYISPEQSGRVNRTLDYRTDLYSLGVTFYQLLSGKLPFENNQAIEIVHCHIAKSPTPLVEINPEIPLMISEIVMKLMEKNAEDRYQSASGLKWDLEQCLLQLEANGEIEPFVLAQKDFSGKLQLPQKLYGRETEMGALLTAFERISRGTGEMILVTGFSGVGKTALVQDFRQLIAERHGRFIIGKFSELQRNIPYSALTQAFNLFCDQLLVESEEHLAHCRKRILANVGNNGQLLIDVIPHLKWVIGQQSITTSANHQSAKNRFNLAFQQFFQTICNKEHPLVLVLDDMQWADPASLDLLKVLMIEVPRQYFLIIGSYRDQEVDTIHPITLMFKELQDNGVIINTLSLQDLKMIDVQVIIAESLQCELDEVQELAQIVYQKTRGNAFFIHEFLKSLYTQELLIFNATRWQWDIDKIDATETSHNVIDLMVDKIHLLPEYTQLSLELASCIGNQFDLKTLSVLCQQSPAEILFYLWPALEQGLLLPLDDYYKQFQEFNNQYNSRFKFQYDRIRQAAYSLVAEANKPALHLQIAQYLLSLYADDIETHVFNIMDQFNLAIVLVETEAMKKEIIRLNLIAGKKAQATFAYQSALNYLIPGLTLLTEQNWVTDYELTFQFYTTIAEVEFLNAHFEAAEKHALVVLQQVEILLDKIKVYEIMISLYMARNQMQLALETTIQVLDQLGVCLEKGPPRELKIENCYHLPRATQPDKLAAMRILNFAIPPAYTVAPHLFPSIVFTMVKLSAEYGNSPLSIFGYSTYGLLLCAMYGEVENGYQAGQLAMNLIRQFNEKGLKARGFAAYYVGVHHWKRPARETIEPLSEAAHSSLESGDFEFTGITAMHCGSYLFWVGELLKNVAATQVQLLTMMQSVKQDYQQIYLNIWRQTVDNLQELNSTPGRLVGKWFNEDEVLPNVLKTNYGMAIFGIYLAKSMLYYLFKDYAQSVHYATLAKDYEQANVGVMVVPICKFYHSLALLASYSESTIPEKLGIIQKVDSNQTQMKQWAFHAPQNYQHRYDLVEAEKAKVLGQLEAIEWYEQAIQHAKDHLYLQEEALSLELAAEFYLERKMEKFAQLYLKEAHHRYQQWGAMTKVNDLENRYSYWLSSSTVVDPLLVSDSVTMKRESTTTSLDLGSIIKASQTLSGEILLEKLLEKLMHTIIENAGAQRGVFILEKQGKWVIEAEGALNQELVNVLQSLPLSNRVSTTIVNYVIRTEKPVVLDRATQEGLYREEDYIRRHHLKSVLCMPIISQKKLGAIVYLENNLIEGAFTPNRIEVLTLLSSQIAISLKNALFIKDLEIARQQAEIANQAKTAFLANMSHEFKTPLNSILGHVQLLNREDHLPITTIRNSCHVIQQNSEYLLTLINDIIDIATIETGRMELHPLNVRFDHFLNNLIHIFKNRAQEKSLEFHYQVSPELPIGIYIDEKRLRQILTHLLSNAIKFTQRGKVIFTVYPYDDKTRFKVEDSGIGIVSVNLEKIFLPFEQVNHWKQKSTGTGLGLSLAKKLTEMMQGTLGVESEVGRGSCFWVDLPLTKSTEWMGEHFEEITSENLTPSLESTEEELINAINLLPIEKTELLLNLSRNGDVIALLKQADQLEQAGPQFNALVTKIRQTAQIYDTDTVGDLLEAHKFSISK